MNDEPHIRLVDAETERIGRDHDRLFAAHERLLRRLALCVLHLAVVLADRVVACLEPLAQPLDELHGRAVDDDGAIFIPLAQLPFDGLEEHIFGRWLALTLANLAVVDVIDAQMEVVAAQRCAEPFGVWNAERLANKGNIVESSGSCQCNDLRPVRERMNEAATLP